MLSWRNCGGRVKARDVYVDSQDELTRPREDPLSLLPTMFVVAQLLVSPGISRRIVRRAVDNYSLTAEAARRIDSLRAAVNNHRFHATNRR